MSAATWKETIINTTSSNAYAQIATTEPDEKQAASSAVATVSTTGSVNATQAAIDFLNENLNPTLVDATDLAEDQVVNGTVIGGRLDVVQGHLVYNVTVVDSDNEVMYEVDIDPNTGRVLTTSAVGAPFGILFTTENDLMIEFLSQNLMQPG
ncbi:PepSY domain-containing protein [Candidatus Nitrososphaera evergladensis]|uniref:PepSY domain-containing protein n=1 Tax=Candidatus Nitrososphaera evergladensis TaxID=1459637 RepID=UPI00130E4A08|nr:PepSY domain-containing protein [Candidatus Nitrososphaera evergladensis]